MENSYGNKSTSDVIVYLIPISMTEESRDAGRKQMRNSESMEGPLVTLNLHSERLRRCSKYFQIVLEKRWSNSNRQSPLEFFLEVQTDVKYYEDCFSRMYAPNYRGIPSVHHALELLKIASQIEFAKLMKASVGYLSLVQWSLAEEQMIRKFPFPLYISSSGLNELNERLRLHGTVEESYQRLYEVGLDYLRSSLDSAAECAYYGGWQSSCEIFAAAFYGIVQSGSCYDLAKDACALVTEKAKAALLGIAEGVEGTDVVEFNFRVICWLFKVLINARGAKKLVKHIVRDRFFCDCVLKTYGGKKSEFFYDREWPLIWATTLLSIFEEVLAGRLLLKSSDRVILFSDWEWLFDIMSDENLDDVKLKGAPLILSSFMMTLPNEHHTSKLKEMLREVDTQYGFYYPQCNVISVAYPLWIKNLQRSLVALDSARAEVVPKNADEPGSSSPATSK